MVRIPSGSSDFGSGFPHDLAGSEDSPTGIFCAVLVILLRIREGFPTVSVSSRNVLLFVNSTAPQVPDADSSMIYEHPF